VAASAARLADWARSIKRDVRAVYLASRDPRTPWYAKAVAIGVAAYALSPIDLIPDFIPVVGQLDELIILPLGIWLAVRMIPPEVMEEHRAAALLAEQAPRSMAGAAAIILIWLVLTAAAGWLAYRWLAEP
jgi:uncharacterized membrane protein YkvA (DUF1232 family)